jgi:hypothetical protein
MKRQTSLSERNGPTSSKRNRQTFTPSCIFSISYELMTAIMSFLEISSSLAFLRTCITLYTCYEQHYKEKTMAVLYDLQTSFTHYDDSVKALYEYICQHGWVRLKLAPISDFQNDNYLMRVLCLNERLNLPNGVNGTGVNDLIIASSLGEYTPPMSFFKFENTRAQKCFFK